MHPGVVPRHQRVAFKHGLPGAPVGGGFTIVQTLPGMPQAAGPWMRLGEQGGGQNSTRNDCSLLPPLQAKYYGFMRRK